MRRIFAFLALAVLLASCGGPAVPSATPTLPVGAPSPGPEPTPGGDQATISFAAWDYERSVYEPLAEKFNQENPGITVVIISLDDFMSVDPAAAGETSDSQMAMLRRIVSGADTSYAFAITPEALGTPLLLDLAPQMDADATFNREDFYPGALERWSKGGGIYALPRSFYVQTLTYNKDLFQVAGLSDPQPGWSWSELLAAAEQVQQTIGSSGYGYLDTSGGMLPALSMLKQRGIDLLTLNPFEVQLTDPAYNETLETIQDLYKRRVMFNPYGGGMPGVGQPVDPQQILRDGQAAIWGDIGLFSPEGNPEQPAYQVGHVPYPADTPVDLLFGGGGEGYIVSGGTAYPEASWKWIEFLSRQPFEQAGPGVYQPNNRVPAREALAEAMGFWSGIDEETAAAYRWVLSQAGKSPLATYDYTAIGSFGQAVSMVTSDPSSDISTVLADVQRQLEDTLAQMSTTPTPEPDTNPVIVATPESQVIPEGATVINFASWGYGGPELRRMIRTFREEHPDIYIQIKNTDTFTSSVNIRDLAGISDCFTWPQPPMEQADLDSLLDIRPFIDADAAFPRDDIPPALISAYEQNGVLYGLPYAFNLRTLTYNRTLFDQAGVTPPGKTPLTPDEFIQMAQALTSGSGDAAIYGYVPMGGAQADLFFFTDVLGGRLISGSGTNVQPTFALPETVDAVQWYLDLPAVQKITPPYVFNYRRTDSAQDRSYELISGGKAAMWLDYGRGGFGMGGPVKDFISARPIGPVDPNAPTFEVGIAPLPIGQQGLGRSDFYVRGFHISKNSASPQGCWEFIKFMSTDVSQIYGDIPARMSVAQSDAYTSIAAPDRLEVLDIYSEALQRPIRQGSDANAIYMLDTYWLFKALSNAATGKGELGAELEAAQRDTTTYAECVAKGGQPADCALEADPEYDGYNTEQPIDVMPVPRG